MRHPVFAANWKMNHGPSAARSFLRTFLSHYPRQYDRTIIFIPPAATLPAVVQETDGRPDIQTGIQNISWADHGAFTGEISAPIARDTGASHALVGHSERRQLFGETDAQTADKCAAASRAGLHPILCVGETLAERERDEASTVVLRQLRAGLSKLSQDGLHNVSIAYEPVWAIGTGRTASPKDASEMHGIIRQELKNFVGDRAHAIHILYGGSVNPGNAPSLLQASDVDGVLVGGASLDPGSWSAIVRA